MSTHDVPGANPDNGDALSVGCWGEHEDGTLLFVESTEGDAVIYSLFDLSKTPPLEYRDRMPVGDFEKMFSCDTKSIGSPYTDKSGRTAKKLQWTWHDKSAFPWDRVMDAGTPDGSRLPSASALLSAAERVARDLELRARSVHIPSQGGATDIKTRIQRAIDAFLT